MATYNLNEVLKERERKLAGETTDSGEIALDDVSRVKVLSPGRQVLKRFLRNRLAVFGTAVLAVMFIFSFLGPLIYPYGQKQIFYKYTTQNVDYALAKENTAYNGYDTGSGTEVERAVTNVINSTIKKMISAGSTAAAVSGEEGNYLVREIGHETFTLSKADLKEVAQIGSGTTKVGVYDSIKKEIRYEGAKIEGLDAAAAEAISGKSGTFEFDGVTYSFTRGAAKSYELTSALDGLRYTGEELGAGFEDALNEAVETGANFSFGGKEYVLEEEQNRYVVYESAEAEPLRVYSRLMFDTMTSGTRVSDAFKAAAYLATERGGKFEAEGKTYTLREEHGNFFIDDADGNEYAEMTSFSVRRYSGADTMAYDLKKAVSEKIADMIEKNEKTGSLMYNLPQQSESGEYVYGEDGKLLYAETELVINQRDTGEYVIKADQINYVIDIFASPTRAHILGTDGDGFDVLARIMYGGRISLMVGFVVVFLEILLGVIMGGIAGYFGGWVDNLIMRLVDVFYCLPSMPIMIIIGAMMDAMRMDTYVRLMIMMAALGIMGWAGVARLVRGQILSLREQEFMVATEATGIRVKDRIFRHLVPNVMPQLIVTATMGLGGVILTESTLSFLGLGVKHPLATWGTIINSVSSASAMAHYAYIWIPVGLLICFTVIAFNFVGDGLRDAYDPKAKR